MRNHFFTRPHAERGRLRHISSSRSAIPRSVFNYLIPHREHSSGLHSHSIPVFSPNANTAFLTHSGHGHNGTPVSIPFKSLQIVPPHLCWKSDKISLEYRGVPLPAVRSPATTIAPINAPQVLSMHPMPAANPAVNFISSSEFTGSLSSNAFNTACVQLHCPVAFNSAAYSARSSIVIIILLCIFSYIMFSTQPHPNKPFLVLPEATINFHG